MAPVESNTVMSALAIGAPVAAIPVKTYSVFVVMEHPENGLDVLDDALHAVNVTELVDVFLLPSVMVTVAT